MENDNVTRLYESMQTMFQPMAANTEAAATRACDFWRGQDKVLDSMQAFAKGWFERRHLGTQAALEAARRMCAAKTPFDFMREYQEWATGALQRMAGDSLALQHEVTDIANAMVESQTHAVATTVIAPQAAA